MSATTFPAALDAAVLTPLVRRVRTDKTAVKATDGACHWTDAALTSERLHAHLNGGKARGCCPIEAGSSTVRLAVLDLDAHKGETPWAQMQAAAARVCQALEAQGLRPVPFRSSGGAGIHLYLLWDAPQDARSVRVALRAVLATCGFADGTAGVARGAIEVFPKQNSVAQGRYGSMFILPLAGQSEPLDWELGTLAPRGREAAVGLDWPMSDPVPVAQAPQVVALAGEVSPDADRAARALAAIPNTLDSREDWFRLLCAFKEATQGEGVEAALQWSAQHASHDEGKFYKAWDSITLGRAGGAPPDYLYSMAAQHGFTEALLDDFDAIAPPTLAQARGLPAFVRDGKGRIEATVGNVLMALRRPDVCGVHIGLDQFNDDVMLAPATQSSEDRQWRLFTDADYTRLREGLARGGFKEIGRELVRDAAMLVAQENTFDSATVWMNGLPAHDGVPRVEMFLHRYCGAQDTPYTRAVSRYLWTALAGRVLEPGCLAPMALVWLGAQGVGKSRAVRALAPDVAQFVEINLAVRDDNLARSLRGKLVGELGELRGLAGRESEDIKGWISRQFEAWTPKYKEFETKFPRRLVLIGTTNEEEFLVDPTGNRRWLPLRVGEAGRVDVAAICRDRDQLWAEGRVLFELLGVDWQGAETLAKAEHADYQVHDTWADAVQRWLDEPALDDTLPRTRPFLRTSEVLREALGIEPKAARRGDEMRIGKVLREMGWCRRKVWHGGRAIWGFVLPTAPTCA